MIDRITYNRFLFDRFRILTNKGKNIIIKRKKNSNINCCPANTVIARTVKSMKRNRSEFD